MFVETTSLHEGSQELSVADGVRETQKNDRIIRKAGGVIPQHSVPIAVFGACFQPHMSPVDY